MPIIPALNLKKFYFIKDSCHVLLLIEGVKLGVILLLRVELELELEFQRVPLEPKGKPKAHVILGGQAISSEG